MPGTKAILIVEDEPLIAMMLEDFLETLGHEVAASCDNVGDALGHIESASFDVAILDVRLMYGVQIWPVAVALAVAGMPFVLATGGHVEPPPARHADAPVLAKPYTIDAIEPALARALGR
jgi:DNA-binding NtrC family response regulator